MLLIVRIQIQHEVRNRAAIKVIVCQCSGTFQMRMVEQTSSCMTQLHFDLLMDLFKMSTSHYTQVATFAILLQCPYTFWKGYFPPSSDIFCLPHGCVCYYLFNIYHTDQDKSSKHSFTPSGQLLVLMQDHDTSYCAITG